MGDESLKLREDGYIRMNFPVTSLTYHSNLNIILVKTDAGGVHVLDVNTGVILQSSCLLADDGGTRGVEYASGADRVFVWDSNGVGARTDYNGVLLLHTALQRPLSSSQSERNIKVELVLSEAVLLYQCLQSLDAHSIEGLNEVVNVLKKAIDVEPVRKGVKAQKWSTVIITLPPSTLRLVTTSVVQELKGQNRRVPALAIASAVGQRANELIPCSRDEENRPLMYSEAERKETFKRWPHMDYKWALPARMAQAGFYHQPSPSGDDRAMCFTCLVCLVCWEKSDEPWVEHERHSPNCPFVRGEYTHNVPISVSNATACAVPCPSVTIVSKGNTGDLIASGTAEGKVNVWKFECGLKLVKFIHLSPYDSIFSGILSSDHNKVWSTTLEKDSSTYGIELTAMAFIGMTSRQETHTQTMATENVERETNTNKTKPSLVCAVIVTKTCLPQTDGPVTDDSSKALFDAGAEISTESVQTTNSENEATSLNAPTSKMLFLLTYDIHSSLAGSITTVVPTTNSTGNSKPGGSKKVCAVPRTDDACIYDEVYFQYSDEDTELPQCPNNLIDEQISNVINLNASSSKDDCNIWDHKQIILTKHFKVLPGPIGLLPELHDSEQPNMVDFVGKLSQLKKCWKNSVTSKLKDQTDSVMHQVDPLNHYLNINGPLEISDIKFYEGIGEGTEKVKLTTFGGSKVGSQTQAVNATNEGFDEPPPEEAVSQGIAVQCLNLPLFLNLKENAKVTHLLPTEDKEHLIVVISSIDPDTVKMEEETDHDGDVKMEVDEVTEQYEKYSDIKAYIILYKINNKASICTIEDVPVTVQELPYHESPVDLCLLPSDKQDQYSFAAVGVDGVLRLYSLPGLKNMSEKRVPKGHFVSVVYCASVDRLSVSTRHGMIYFYALNNGDKDSARDQDDDEFANIDFDMLQSAPRDEVCGPFAAPVIIANKTELDLGDLQALASLTGCYGSNATVPYSAVVPGFWCELSPAQRPRSDHQNNRTWRLQNTSSTWDEHVLEITLPYSVSLAHIEFSFTLHVANSANLPMILVTLLKQNLHGIGYKKDAVFGVRSESPDVFLEPDTDLTNLDNPINCEEYLQAHNAEILAGPLVLSTGLDLSQQTGTLTLTSPLLYRARGRTFLIHIKTLFDPAKDPGKGLGKSSESNSKKSGFIGCDWLHQISLTVRSTPHTDVPMERQQRITMLESNTFLNTLFELATSKDSCEKRILALDMIIWIISIRLQRMRLISTETGKDKSAETQQLECVRIIEKHVDALIKNCILCGNRSLAKKCMKIILVTCDGAKQLPKPSKSTFDAIVSESVCACIPYLGACESAGALRWMAALGQYVAQHAYQQSVSQGAEQQDASSTNPKSVITELVSGCLGLLQCTARNLRERAIPYHDLLRARFGLYGLPLERTIFATEIPDLGRNNNTSASSSYASTPTGESTVTNKQECLLKDLLNLPVDADPKSLASSVAWWNQNNGVGVFAAGLNEAMPLHVTCHMASDGTKLESTGSRYYPAVVNSLPNAGPADAHQFWNVVMDGHVKQPSHDPDSLEDAESSLMDCDPQEKSQSSEEKIFKEDDVCNIPWSMLVSRPPQHTLVVERMHSGARRFIVLDFGHTVRLTDIIIPSCSDLVTLCVDIWMVGEETDCVKLAFAADISNKHLVLTDIQPPPLCRYMKITTIGRYGMSATKCKIPLGWFYGEMTEIANLKGSISSLNALHQDLTCKYKLATGKLIDKLNPFLDMYNGNASHMMSYLGPTSDRDTRVTDLYHDCIELQQQLHTCTNVLNRLLKRPDNNRHVPDMINKGTCSPDSLLVSASTDKLRIISENVVDMLLYYYFQISDAHNGEIQEDWYREVSPLVWEWGGRSAGALATLLARACGDKPWWGMHLADTLTQAFAAYDAPPTPLDRCLVVVMYMCRKSLYAQEDSSRGVAHAFATRTLSLLQTPCAQPSGHAQPALIAALLTTLSSIVDVLALPYTKHSRWDWVSGGKLTNNGSVDNSSSTPPRGCDGKLHRRKLHKKLLHQMQEIDNARRGVHFTLEDQQRARLTLKARMAMLGKRSGIKPESSPSSEAPPPPPRALTPQLAAQLAQAVVAYMLGTDTNATHDILLLCAKVVGRLCALSSGFSQLDPQSILGVARLAVTLPPWPRHALTTLLQDLVEYEGGDSLTSPNEEWSGGSGAGGSRSTPTGSDKCQHGLAKPPRKAKGPTVADILADSFSMNKIIKMPMTVSLKDIDQEEPLSHVAESDDSESSEEKQEHQSFLDSVKKDFKNRHIIENNICCISMCADSRLESVGGGAGGPGESAVRRVLLATSNVFPVAVRTPATAVHRASSPVPAGVAQPGGFGEGSSSAGGRSDAPHVVPREDVTPAQRAQPPLTHTLYDVFRHLALEFPNQMECTFMENVVSLWLTLNGSSWGSGGSLVLGTLPADTPRVRLASDTVAAMLRSLCTLDHVSLRCWVLSMQALAWVASLPLLAEGSSQTMGRVILDCEHFVPAIVKFVTMNVNSDGAVYTSEPYLGGALVGGGGCAAAALHAVVTRVICARGAGGALVALRCVCGAWVRAAQPNAAATTAYDLHATLLRLTHPMLQLLAPHHEHHIGLALQLFEAVGQLSASWVREQVGTRSDHPISNNSGSGSSGSGGSTSAGESRLSGMLADMMGGAGASARRVPLRRAVLLQLLHYCRVLLAIPLPPSTQAPSASGSASTSTAPEQCLTDESKAQHSARDSINVEDERKQQAARSPCLADTVLRQHTTMHYFYRTLSMNDGTNISLKNVEKNSISMLTDGTTFMEELYCLVAHIINVASNPSLMVHSLMEFLRREEVVQLSQGLQHLIIRLLDNPEALNAFIDAGGLELAIEKLVAFHQLGPSSGQGLVASLMNYLKLPPQLINLSISANSGNNKKNQMPVVDPANGLINIAPLCTVSCGNPTAQPADVLLEGGAAASARGACAARRVRAAAWSYHFFSVDDASLALTVTLPYAALLHELHLQPHLTSLATCPGAVAVEAGCGGTLSPLGPPQSTSGMTFIRLVLSRPVLATTVQVRLYKPRDSANMGLLQLRLLVAPAFNMSSHISESNNWSSVVFACTRTGVHWAGAYSAAALGALCACACLPARGLAARHAHRSVLALARDVPHLRHAILAALLAMDTQRHAYGSPGSDTENMNSVCSLVRQVCVQSAALSVNSFVQWVSTAAENWLRTRTSPPAALLHTLGAVLWTLKEKEVENIQELISDDLFELLYTWINEVPEKSMLKKALDSILCSVCYIRPELFKTLLEHMNIRVDEDDSMEGMTDDTKVQGSPVRTVIDAGVADSAARSGAEAEGVVWRTRALRSIAIASMSPTNAHTLLRSRLPDAVVNAIAEFSEAKLAVITEYNELQEGNKTSPSVESMSLCPNTGVSSMKRVCLLVEWARLVSSDRRFKDWLGGAGSIFWAPLLRLLCHARNRECTWQESAQYAQLEEETIRLFHELTVCHVPNQKLFAATLYNILESQQYRGTEGISGFTRALIVRLVLSPERVRVSMRWIGRSNTVQDVAEKGGARADEPWAGGVASHPSLQHHKLVNVPLDMTLSDLVGANNSTIEDSKSGSNSGVGASSVLRSASDTAIPSVTEAWELSLAAGSASKDKRLKDVKNTNLKNYTQKKRHIRIEDIALLSPADFFGASRRELLVPETAENEIRVRVAGLVGWIPPNVTLAQLAAAVPYSYGPHVALTMHVNDGEALTGPTWEACPSASTDAEPTSSTSADSAAVNSKSGGLVREFGACGGLALVAARLPRPRAGPPDPPAPPPQHDLDWVKIEDPYEDGMEISSGAIIGGGVGGGASGGGASGATSGTNGGDESGCGGVPAHALLALGLLLKLPGYADALLDEGPRAVHLLRLLLGVTHDEDGRNIPVSGMTSEHSGVGVGGKWSLGTLPFVVVSRLLEQEGRAGRSSPEGRELRRALLSLGAVRLVLGCLAVFTHHRPTSTENSHGANGTSGKIEEKNQLYWAKGTGFGTGSTQQSWNVEQALMRQRTEEENVTVLLQVLASYMNPGEKWPPEEGQESNEETDNNTTNDNEETTTDLAPEFIDLIANSSLVPAICSYLRNDSVLDMSRHIPLYVCVLRCARGVHGVRCERLGSALRPLPRLLSQMSRTTNSYATKLKMSKKNIFGKMTYSQRFSSSTNTELSEEDEGLATLIADIQATSALMCRVRGSDDETGRGNSSGDPALSAFTPASREVRYLDLMRTMQFDTYEMITECADSGCGFRFTVPYHFEGTVRSAGERAHPARMKRLAQEAATLATSLPLSYSSSVFVRYDSVRLDVMKVLITGPSDTPYANGCFILDVYFPAEYPAVPMLINLETTGRHSVRFNPNLYNDGKVCLSVLNTWHGRPEEKWNAHTSSFLQVLVSIQSLILVPEPYFNEPGYERSRGTRVGNSASLEYNSNIYQACVRWAMLDHLRNPEPCFKEVIQTHFWIKRNEIMQTVASWITELEGQSGDERTQNSIRMNLVALKRHYVKLQEELAKLPVPAGLEELDEPFQLPTAPAAVPSAPDETMYSDFEKIVSEVLD